MAKKTLPKQEVKVFNLPCRVYATYHPSAVLKGGFELEPRIEEDFRRFRAEQLEAPANRPPKGDRGAMVGYDTEYDPSSNLLTIGVANKRCAVAAEVNDKKGIAQAKAIIKHAKTLAGHSITGDLDQLVKLGLAKESWLRGDAIRDSFLLARMVDENRGKGGYGLEALLLSEFNFDSWKQETEKLLKKTGNASDWSVEQRTARCRLDAWATAVLAEQFERALNKERENGSREAGADCS